jgi:hypothetical protein
LHKLSPTCLPFDIERDTHADYVVARAPVLLEDISQTQMRFRACISAINPFKSIVYG